MDKIQIGYNKFYLYLGMISAGKASKLRLVSKVMNGILWFLSNTCNRKFMWTASCDSGQTPATENTCGQTASCDSGQPPATVDACDERHPVIIAQHLKQLIMNGILRFLSHTSNNKYKWKASCDSCPTPVTEVACDERHLAILVKHLQQSIHVNIILWFPVKHLKQKIHANRILWFLSNFYKILKFFILYFELAHSICCIC